MSKELTQCRPTGTAKKYGVYASKDLAKGTAIWLETPEENFDIYKQEDMQQMTKEQKKSPRAFWNCHRQRHCDSVSLCKSLG